MGNCQAVSLLVLGVGISILSAIFPNSAIAAINPADAAAQQELLQEERERALRGRQEATPDVRSTPVPALAVPEFYPDHETPCFSISSIELVGDAAL